MKVELIPAEQRFADLSYRWRSEANTVRYNPLAPTTLERFRERLAMACSSLADLKAAPEFLFFARVDGQVMASVSLRNVNHMMMHAEIGYTVGEEFHGRGVGTAVVRAFVGKIFAETKLRRLYAFVAEGNTPSCRLLERLGFVREGVLREHYLIQGEPVNEVFYGILRSEGERLGREA